MQLPTPLIAAADLLQRLASDPRICVFDCSFDLANPGAGDAQYAAGHIPGAQRADLDRDLSAHGAPDAASAGRHPLPSRNAWAAWLGRHGVRPDTPVVVYDRQGCHYCGRMWWMLHWLGHQQVAVLDGGWPAWLAAGGAASTDQPTAIFEQYDPPAQSEWALIDTNFVASQLGRSGFTLVDARAGARFRGEVEPLDPVPGHIPGALNRPYTDNFESDGRFKPAAQLRAEWAAVLAGADPAGVVHHCGSGVSAVPNLIAMQLAGLGATGLYAGSYSAWSRTPGLPIAQG